MRIAGAPRASGLRRYRAGRLGRYMAASGILFAMWAGTSDAGPSELYGKPAALPAISATTLAVRYVANRRAIEQALHTAERVDDDDRVRAFSGFLRPGRRFLSFDPRSTGRAVEVVGDLANAQRVVVLVPGADTSLTTFDTRGDKPYSTPGGGARALYRQVMAINSSARLAVVAWLGYQPPATLSAGAVIDERAESGAAGLRSFVHSLGRVNPSARTTLLCHSYGSVVCGEAAKGLRVGEIAAFGSPGMSAPSDAALGTRARIWAGRGTGDWTRLVPHLHLLGMGHGADPVSPRFGAHVFDAGHAGHSDYLRPGSLSLRNLALIALGRDADVTVA